MIETGTMKLRRRLIGESHGRCLLTNPEQVRGAISRAVGIERWNVEQAS